MGEPFSDYCDNFDPETLAILEIAFNQAWEVLLASGGVFDPKATRDALAELIISFAAEGETDPKRLKQLALAALPRTLETPIGKAPAEADAERFTHGNPGQIERHNGASSSRCQGKA